MFLKSKNILLNGSWSLLFPWPKFFARFVPHLASCLYHPPKSAVWISFISLSQLDLPLIPGILSKTEPSGFISFITSFFVHSVTNHRCLKIFESCSAFLLAHVRWSQYVECGDRKLHPKTGRSCTGMLWYQLQYLGTSLFSRISTTIWVQN